MAFELVEEVLDHAPPMTAAERLILVCIAERSRLVDRAAKIAGEELRRRTGGMGERGIRDALTRLAERHLEVRLPIGYDRHGVPFYAVPDRIRHFWVPHLLPAPGDCKCLGCRIGDRACFTFSDKEEPQFPLSVVEGGKAEPQLRQAEPQLLLGGATAPSGGATAPPIPSVEPYRNDEDQHPYDRRLLLSQLEAARLKRQGRSQPS